MRVSTRIILGSSVLIILTLVALAYQVSAIHQMQSVNRDLASMDFLAASTALRMLQEGEAIEEFSKKYFTVDPPFYETQFGDALVDFSDDLNLLVRTVRSKEEVIEAERLTKAWDDFQAEVRKQKNDIRGGAKDFLPASLSAAITHFQAQTDRTYNVIQQSIRTRVTNAAEVGAAAERFSWISGVVAIVLSTIVVILIVGAINRPLRNLTRSTRMIAKGQFWHRLPAEGGDEFSELAKDFNTMSAKLGELDAMKKDFVSHVSHELKAPLASIRQIGNLLLQEIPGPLVEQQKRLLRLSYNSAERLAAMVGNLLDISRMEAGTMEYEVDKHDLVSLVRAVAEEFEIQANEKGIGLRLENDQQSIFAECDRDRLVQVIGNLFENALKFAPPESDIVVRVDNRDGNALISVTDSGPGVPGEHKERIFRRFHQVKQGKKIAGQGVGLGLAICKTIVEAHRGTIWVEDNPSGGSVFKVTLPTILSAETVQCK